MPRPQEQRRLDSRFRGNDEKVYRRLMPKTKPQRPQPDREVILVKDLDDETLEAIRNAEPSEESKRLGHLLDDPKA
jgi:hypothetical protein